MLLNPNNKFRVLQIKYLGLKDILNIKVVDGARVVTNNGNRFKYIKGHWKRVHSISDNW